VARKPSVALLLCLAAVAPSGCNSPYHADRGALLGGLFGAGTGAVIGSATGQPGAGAAIGAGLGALGGAAVGNAIDESEAKNRAMIAQQLGRQVAPGAVTVSDAIAMTKAGVGEELIATHVRNNGMNAPLQTDDIIRMQQEGVSPRVIAAMQASPPREAQAVVVRQPAPVIIEETPYYVPYYGPRCRAHVHYTWR